MSEWTGDKDRVNMPAKSVDEGLPAVICLALLAFVLVMAEFLPISLLTPISDDLSMSAAVAGQLVTITAISATIGGPTILIFFKQTDRKILLLWLIAFLVVSCVTSALATNELVVILSRVFTGIALGGFWTLSAAIAIRLVQPRRAAKSLALIATGVSTATVLAGPSAAVIGDMFGWRAAMVGVGLLAAALFVAMLRILPAIPVTRSLKPADLKEIVRYPGIRMGLSILILIVTGHFSAFVFIRPFLETVTLEASWISSQLLIFGVCGVVGNLLGGMISSRSPLLSTAVSALLLSGAGTALLWGGAGGLWGAVCVGLWGLAFGAAPLSIQAYLLAVSPDHAEATGAWNLVTFQLSIASGALLGAHLISVYGPLSLLLPMIALPMIAVILIGAKQWAQAAGGNRPST